jgi:hypothetical protein
MKRISGMDIHICNPEALVMGGVKHEKTPYNNPLTILPMD